MKEFKKFIILLLSWVGIVLLESKLAPFSISWMIVALLAFPLAIYLFFLAVGIIFELFFWIIGSILSVLTQKKHDKRSRRGQIDSFTEQVTLDHPDYIGILTKIDKKQIAEEYLTEQKRKKGHERK